MYDRILFPTDGSEPAESVLDYALQIASEHEATIHVVNVVDTGQDGLARLRDDVIDVLEREGEVIVNETAERATDRDIPAVSEVLQGDPHTSIVAYSDRSDIDLIVMPTHGRRGLERTLLGSVTERVITTADVPVVAVNPDRNRPLTYPCRNLLVPIDGSRGAALALNEGVAVAKATGATLHLLHVVETGSLGPEARSVSMESELTERANEIIADATETAAAASLDRVVSEIEDGVPSEAIRSYAEANGVDLAILGTHGETDFSRYVLGGVSAKIVRTSPVPVMWVRGPDAEARD
jgi:nucleotide-binding universal stress UspA family protein